MPGLSMFPHTVTLYNVSEDQVTFERFINITILQGVFFDAAKAANVRTSGLEGADAVNLYIPFDVTAVDGVTLLEKRYVGPKEYARADGKTGIWTLDIGKQAKGDCFFVKGEVVEPERDRAYINLNYDDVYVVTKVDEKDFGAADLKHWEVGGN